MIDVSQVLEFSAKLYLLKQLPLTKIAHRSTLKLAPTRSFGRGRLMEGECLLYHKQSSIKEGYVEGTRARITGP